MNYINKYKIESSIQTFSINVQTHTELSYLEPKIEYGYSTILNNYRDLKLDGI